MSRRFVIEAVLVATYGQLMAPIRPVEYIIPYSTIMELYDMKDSDEPIMMDAGDEAHVREKIGELIAFFEQPLHRKRLEKTLVAPWKKTTPLQADDNVWFTVVNAVDNAQYGELFDPVETELILASVREQAPVLTDQLEFQDKVIEQEVPVQLFDVEDFDYAVEAEEFDQDWRRTDG